MYKRKGDFIVLELPGVCPTLQREPSPVQLLLKFCLVSFCLLRRIKPFNFVSSLHKEVLQGTRNYMYVVTELHNKFGYHELFCCLWEGTKIFNEIRCENMVNLSNFVKIFNSAEVIRGYYLRRSDR